MDSCKKKKKDEMRKSIQNQRWPKGWNTMIKFGGPQKATGVDKSWSKGIKKGQKQTLFIFSPRVSARDLV